MVKKASETDKRDYGRLRETAEGMFINQNLTGQQVADALGISEVTVSRWRQAGEWDAKKRFVQITPSRLREKLLQEAERVANGEASVIKADVIVKLLAGADKLAARATPEVIYSVLAECCTYTAAADPEFAARMAEHHRQFLQHKIEQES